MTIHKRLYFLSFILIAFFFACVSFFLEGHAYFGNDHNRNMTDLEFFLSFMVACFSIGILCLLAFRSFQIRLKWWLIIFLGFFCITSLLALFVFPGVFYNGNLVYSIDAIDIVRYSCVTLIVFASLYVCIGILPSMTGGSTIYDLVFLSAVVLAIVAIIWSYLVETDLYDKLFAYGFPANGYVVPKSFTANRNIYGFILFFGIVGEAYLHVKRPHWWRWIIMAFIFFNQFFVLSKTSIIISIFFLACFIIWTFVRSIMAHPHRNVISLALVSASLMGLWLGGAFNSGGLLGWFGDYFRFVWQLFITNSSPSFLSRLQCYTEAFNAVTLSPITTILGFGFGNWTSSLYAAKSGSSSAFIPMDNAWAVDFLQNGIFGFILSFAIWIFVFVFIFKALLRKKTNAWVILFLALAIIAHTLTEAGDFTYLNATGAVLFCTIYLPIASELKADKDIGEEKAIEKRYFAYPYPKLKPFSSLDVSWLFFLLIPLVVLFFGLSFGFAYESGISVLANAFLCVNVLVGFFAFPISYDCIKTLWKSKRNIAVMAFVILALYSISALILPFLAVGIIAFIVPLVLLGILVGIFVYNRALLVFSKYKKPFFLALIFSASLIIADNIFIWIFLNQLTAYSLICIALLDVIVWYVFFYLKNFRVQQWNIIEDHFLRLEIKRQLRSDLLVIKDERPKHPYKKISIQ
jgi:hypothetical protein